MSNKWNKKKKITDYIVSFHLKLKKKPSSGLEYL